MELKLKSTAIDLPQRIENLEALKAELVPRLEKYKNLVVTEESIKAAKDDKAALNKLKKAIEEQRISIKKQYLEPYNALEAQCKELVKLIDEPIQEIDKQIKEFEDLEKKNKFAALTTAFDELKAPTWLHINDVLNPKWENKTQKLDSLIAEITENVSTKVKELEQLMEMYKDFPHKLAIEQKYKECKDFSKTAVYAVALVSDYEKERKRKEEEERRKLAEEAMHSQSVSNAPASSPNESNINTPPVQQTAVSVESEQTEKLLVGKFTVRCTKDKLIALVSFMKSQGIEYKPLKDKEGK